jgi:cytochrome c oxidase subunit 2
MILPGLFTLPAAEGGGFWLPEQASTVAESVDGAWWLVYWVSAIFFAIIVVAQVWFMWTYRRRAGWTEQKTAHHNFPLELTWSIIPSIIIVVMFVKGFLGFLDMRTPPSGTYDITVVSKQWSWTFIYPNGVVHPELHVPVNRNVKLIMSSEDVIHSLFVPQFRVKQDIVPGRYNYLWFNATKEGTYDLECTEYCGRNHSEMRTKVVVHPETGDNCLNKWLAERELEILNMPPIELGEMLYNQRGCSQCHSLDGSKRVGPSFDQTYGVQHEFSGGVTRTGDEEYIRESIENPQALVRAGFPPSMPTFKGTLRPIEMRGLVSFIKGQNPKFKAEAEQESANAPKLNADGTPVKEGEAGAGEGDAAEDKQAEVEC